MPELCRLHVYCDPTKRDWLGVHWQWGISRPEGWVLSLHSYTSRGWAIRAGRKAAYKVRKAKHAYEEVFEDA